MTIKEYVWLLIIILIYPLPVVICWILIYRDRKNMDEPFIIALTAIIPVINLLLMWGGISNEIEKYKKKKQNKQQWIKNLFK